MEPRSEDLEGKRLVLFDGVCNVCDTLVMFIIDRDPDEKFVFAPLTSARAEKVLAEHRIPPNPDTVVLIEDGRSYRQSTAILRVLGSMRGIWKLAWLGFVFPRFVRDGFYRWFARNRYRWFGQLDQCRVPTPELKRRFVGNL
jgi:predicted DCC family thiol-disulfide oxidoreductase YuxK